ncbi:hypothetical protein HWI79_2710 [Cryptosporidium felis]|nr:hypothetical protein HWI79_2710 [Cryptosporidium felis]
MLEDDNGKLEQLFSDLFGRSDSDSREFRDSNRDVELVQQTMIPTLYRTFRRLTTVYGDLVELCTSSEKSRKVFHKRTELGRAYKQHLEHLMATARFFLLLVREICGGGLREEAFREEALVTGLSVKLLHELLGSPGTKDCTVFLMELAFLQGNRLLADQLYDYLVGLPSSIQSECYRIRRSLESFLGQSFDHQLLPLTSNFESYKYFTYISDREESMAMVLFKIRNLVRNLWRVDKSYKDLMAWWGTLGSDLLEPLKKVTSERLYERLEGFGFEGSEFLSASDPGELWILSTLCGVTGSVLYVAYQSILDGDDQVEEAVSSLHLSGKGVPIGELLEEAKKFSLISAILDPPDYRSAWILSLLYLSAGEESSLARSFNFTEQTLRLNPSFGDSWVLYALLWTTGVQKEPDRFRKGIKEFESGVPSEEEPGLRRDKTDSNSYSFGKITPLSATAEFISLLADTDRRKVILKFLYIGYNIFQILRDRENNDDLCYSVISDMRELSQYLSQQEESLNEEPSLERLPEVATSFSPTSSKTKKVRETPDTSRYSPISRDTTVFKETIARDNSRKNRDFREGKSPHSERSYRTVSRDFERSLPLILHPPLFRLQLLVWSLKLKYLFKTDGFHICNEFLLSQLDEFRKQHRDFLERDLDLLDELQVHSHVKLNIKRYTERFSELLELVKETPDCDGSAVDSLLFQSQMGKPTFEVDLMDWRILFSPVQYLY